MRILVLLLGIVFLPSIASAQEKPKEGDSVAYKQAYELLLDSRTRSLKAVELLLPAGKNSADLTDRELSLLCRAYNELADSKKQLATAKQLWDRSPGSAEGTRWMINSLHNNYAYTKNSKPLMDFVDNALAKGLGNRRDLLVFKATAILAQKEELTDAEKRVAVSDLLVDAYKSGPPSKPFEDDQFTVRDSPDFIDYEHPFGSFFSVAERNALKVRMQKARDEGVREK